MLRLAHQPQDPLRYMLRCHLELAADMVLHQFFEKSAILIIHNIIVAKAAAHKYLFYMGHLPYLPQQRKIIAMIHL